MAEDARGGSRWWTLPVVSAAQLSVVLDGTIVNIGPGMLFATRALQGVFGAAGAAVGAGAFVAVVYGFTKAESLGWGSPTVFLLLVAGVALLAGFVAVETRAPHPLLPMRIVLDRIRAGALLGVTLMFLAMFSLYLFVSYYTQTVLGYTPVQAGLVLLVNAVAALVGSMLIARRIAASRLIVGGLLAAAIEMFVMSCVTARSTAVLPLYLVPALALTDLGLGCVMPPTASLATSNLPRATSAPHPRPTTRRSSSAPRSVPPCSTPSRPVRPSPLTLPRPKPQCRATPPHSPSPSSSSSRRPFSPLP